MTVFAARLDFVCGEGHGFIEETKFRVTPQRPEIENSGYLDLIWRGIISHPWDVEVERIDLPSEVVWRAGSAYSAKRSVILLSPKKFYVVAREFSWRAPSEEAEVHYYVIESKEFQTREEALKELLSETED